MSEAPDSALSLLRTIDSKELIGNRRKAHYALMLSMARDKNYIDVTDDSLICIAYNYYKNHGSKRHKMLSTYYSGVVHQNAGDYMTSAIEFDQTLAMAIELNDYHNAGLACSHLSRIHDLNFNHVLSRKYAQMQADFFDKCGETLSADYGRMNVAEQLFRENEYEESMAITDAILASNTHAPLLRSALWMKTDLLITWKHDYKTAIQYLEKIPLRKRKLDTLFYYEYKAFLSQASGNPSKADHFMALAEPLVETSLDSLTFFSHASDTYELRGDYKNAYHYQDSALKIQHKQISLLLWQSVTNTLENYYRESLADEKERSATNRLIYVLVSIILIMAIAALVLYVHKQKQERIQDMADIDALNKDIITLKRTNEGFKALSSAVLQERVLLLKQLSDSYFAWDDKEVKMNSLLTKEEIITRFRKHLGELRSDKKLFGMLEDAVNISNEHIVEHLRTEYNGILKEQDYYILSMLFCGLSIKSISFLLRMSEPSLRTRKTRYKQLFESHPTEHSARFIQLLS